MGDDYILEMEHITKTFPGVKALNDVTLNVSKGKVHALVGENGAGKSTLMKILIGVHLPDSGRITFNGARVGFKKPLDALNIGISMIHQELSPVPYMTIAENIYLGREPLVGKTGWINDPKLEQDTKDLLESLEIFLDPKAQLRQLSIANMQLVEIAKAISYHSKLIIMDEPTSAITDKEVKQLFKIIRSLTQKGISVIYISHKLDEIFKIADEVTVLRDGEYVGTESTKNLTHDRLIEMMVGRVLNNLFPKQETQISDVVLEVRNLSQKGKFSNISFKVRRGEILGVAGLVGAGRTEVMESIFGYQKLDEGEVHISGKQVKINSPEDAIKHGIALLTEDRKLTGLFLPHSVMDNMIIASIKKFLRGPFVNTKAAKVVCEDGKCQLAIKTPSLAQTVNNLSGGNQQKVLISRWLLTDPEILILDEPTRGIDVGAKAEIHHLMSDLAQGGKAIIMISSELPEILGMSDRVIVMHDGKITGELSRREATQDLILKCAMGIVRKDTGAVS